MFYDKKNYNNNHGNIEKQQQAISIKDLKLFMK
jgi:hypothetical protein